MKKGLLFLVCCLSFVVGSAQYCGNSNPSQCTLTINSTAKPGLYPYSDSMPPLLVCATSPAIIQFRNFDTLNFGGQLLHVNWIRYDSIGNLPTGLCYSTNHTNNTFDSLGCIKLSGSICSYPGQYKLQFWVTASISGSIVSSGPNDNDLKYFLRVKNPGDMDTPVDSTQTNANKFIPYGSAPMCADCFAGISDLHSVYSIYPNPATNQLNINTGGIPVEAVNIYNTTGALVGAIHESPLQNTAIDISNLPKGVYVAEIKTKDTTVMRRWVKM